MKSIQTILLCLLAVVLFKPLDAFTVRPQRTVSSLHAPSSNTNNSNRCNVPLPLPHYHTSSSKLQLADLDTVALVAGQDNYGFAVMKMYCNTSLVGPSSWPPDPMRTIANLHMQRTIYPNVHRTRLRKHNGGPGCWDLQRTHGWRCCQPLPH